MTMAERKAGEVSKVAYHPLHSPEHELHNIFNESGWSELKSVLTESKEKSFTAREIIYREAEPAKTVFAIQTGLVKLISYLPNGRARIVRLHAKGALLGLGGLLDPAYEHTAIAVDDVKVCSIPVRVLNRLKEESPYLYCRLIESWYSCLRDADTWITQFSTGSIRARVARLLNFLSEIEYGAFSNKVALLTCEEMAEILGVTQESVSRILAEFKRSNLLRINEKRPPELYDRNIDALQQVARDS